MGVLGIFRKRYVVRRFKPQRIVSGYATAPYEDMAVSLNVQPLTPNELLALPEGERRFRRLKAYGDLLLTASNPKEGIPGDWLYYRGEWYKCVSAVPWDHTILSHCESQFAAVAETEPSANLEPPKLEV